MKILDRRFTIRLPTYHDSAEIRNKLASLVKLVGGTTATNCEGSWYDSAGKLHKELVQQFDFSFSADIAVEFEVTATRVVLAALEAGEQEVMTIGDIGAACIFTQADAPDLRKELEQYA